MGTKTTDLISWIIVLIYSTPELIRTLHDEVHPFAEALQPSQVCAISEPARLEINVAGLVRSCPLLRACLYECLRLHSNPLSMGILQKDLPLLESESCRPSNGERP